MTILFFSLLIDEKQWREKNEEREKEYHVIIREKVFFLNKLKWNIL